jgi:hypothetical protein
MIASLGPLQDFTHIADSRPRIQRTYGQNRYLINQLAADTEHTAGSFVVQMIMGKFAGNQTHFGPPLVGKAQLHGLFTRTVPGKGNVSLTTDAKLTAKDHGLPRVYYFPATEAWPAPHPGQKQDQGI